MRADDLTDANTQLAETWLGFVSVRSDARTPANPGLFRDSSLQNLHDLDGRFQLRKASNEWLEGTHLRLAALRPEPSRCEPILAQMPLTPPDLPSRGRTTLSLQQTPVGANPLDALCSGLPLFGGARQ
jgi:hypothetical protein